MSLTTEQKTKLNKIAQEIRDAVSKKQETASLSFVEDTHTYYIKNLQGEVVTSYPSVSTVLHRFYTPFIAENTKSFKDCGGDPAKEKELLDGWAATGTYASHQGSRVHYLLEKHLIDMYGAYKEVRQPIFECDDEQIKNGDKMITAGKEYIDLMHERGAILLDTEMVLGSAELGYTGQPDKVWVMFDKDGNPGIVITDWKSNKPKNMKPNRWTKPMLHPFHYLDDTALGHYNVQLPLYGKLLLKMLEDSKFKDIKILGCIVVHVTDKGEFNEFKVSKKTIDTTLALDINK